MKKRQNSPDKMYSLSLSLILFFLFRCCFAAGILQFSSSSAKYTELFHSNLISDIFFTFLLEKLLEKLNISPYLRYNSYTKSQLCTAHVFFTFLCRCFERLQRETSRNPLVTYLLIFTLEAASISHFLTATIKFSCYCSNEIGLLCFLSLALALSACYPRQCRH